MKYILSAKNHSVLKKFASGNVLLAFDFDGTLARIVPDPDNAAIRHSTHRLLKQLTSLYPCIVVSGRSRADARKRLRGINLERVIGNHGIDPQNSSRAVARSVEAWLPILKQELGRFHGVVLENKRFSLSIHYRQAGHKQQVIKTIKAVAQTLSGAKLVGGKQVVNIVSEGAPHKGLAVERECSKRRCDGAIYVGDDVTDESVFALARNGRILAIRVGVNRLSLARYYIRNQSEIDRLLEALIQIRSHHTANPDFSK